MILLLILLFTKHFIVDFPLQKPYQWQNKGTYGHPGGILHSGLQSVGTYICLMWFTTPPIALGLALLDGILHYHIDWAKMNLNAKLGYTPADEKFWWLLGLDQLLHAFTYIGIVYVCI